MLIMKKYIVLLSAYIFLANFPVYAAEQIDHKENASNTVHEISVTHTPAYLESLKKYTICNLPELAEHLASGQNVEETSFTTLHITDGVAEYDFYAISDENKLNVDHIRGATCEYVMKNNCRVFWGNILNMAYVAEKPVAAFPADTTPHYMISPEITCNKIKHKGHQAKSSAQDSNETPLKISL